MSELAQLALPPPPMIHPGHGQTKEYASQRKQAQINYIREQVIMIAEPKIDEILKLKSWQAKQDAVDQLFENVEFQLRDQEKVLSSHPLFGIWVEKALETYLRTFKKGGQQPSVNAGESTTSLSSEEGNTVEDNTTSDDASPPEESSSTMTTTDSDTISYPTAEDDAKALPMFMDCFSNEDEEKAMVPSILHPLKPHPHDGPGRMVEEWELSAHSTSKRILLRQSTRKVARILEESINSRVYVTGRKGVGKVSNLQNQEDRERFMLLI